MTQQPTSSNRRISRNDFLFTCSMALIFCLFVAGLIALPLWEGNERQSILSAQATGTAIVDATQQVNITSTAAAHLTEQVHVTATAVAHRTEQAQYRLVDPFESNKNEWRQGREDNEYWYGYTAIQNGVYFWKIEETRKPFVSWADLSSTMDHVGTFDVYVDTKISGGSSGEVCSGLLFRISLFGWENGGYYFSLCSDKMAYIRYYTEKDGWEDITFFRCRKCSSDWNRLEIAARDTHFTFYINGEQMYEMEDDRERIGDLALVVDINQIIPAEVMFDNFGFQPH